MNIGWYSIDMSDDIQVFLEREDDTHYTIIEWFENDGTTIGDIRLEEDGEYSAGSVKGSKSSCVASGPTPELALERWVCLYYELGNCDLCKQYELSDEGAERLLKAADYKKEDLISIDSDEDLNKFLEDTDK